MEFINRKIDKCNNVKELTTLFNHIRVNSYCSDKVANGLLDAIAAKIYTLREQNDQS